jgi:cytochrome c553
MQRKVLLLISLVAIIASCTYKKETVVATVTCADAEGTVSFSSKVSPIIQANCSSCHNNGFKSGGISLEGHTNIKGIAASGLLLGVISHSAGFSQMPKGGDKLSDCNIQTIKKWIEQGTLNN